LVTDEESQPPYYVLGKIERPAAAADESTAPTRAAQQD
jgi:hypothetical protein